MTEHQHAVADGAPTGSPTMSAAAGQGVVDEASWRTSEQAWYKAVAKVFARVQHKDITDIPLDIWKRLIVHTNNGVDIKPLYNRDDELAELAPPGVFPYTRGDKGSEYRNQWGVTETFGGEKINADILHALNYGTTHLVLQPCDLEKELDGVFLELVPIRLDMGAALPDAASELYELIESGDDNAAHHVTMELGAAPLTAVYSGADSVSVEVAVALAADAAHREGAIRAILVDTVALSNQGASDIQEIGYGLAAGVEYLRRLVDAGLSTNEAFRQISFRVAITDDQFSQIAKLRALRQLWARVADVLGCPECGAAHIHAVTAPVMFTQRDPWVNMLRSTVAAFAAGVGGAQDVEVLPFDSAIPGGMPKVSRAFAHRIARNTNLLLLEESHLGHVIDPGGGSYYLESLTDQLADNAWKLFTQVEGNGGFSASTGTITEALAQQAEATRDEVAHRKKKVTGVNEFPNITEAPLPKDSRQPTEWVRRWAEPFENLRNRSDDYLDSTGRRPEVGLIPLGPLAKHNVRTGFATNLLGTAGITALNPGQLEPGTAEFTAAAEASPVAILCGTDGEYAASGEEAIRALRAAGVEEILLAGAPQVCADFADQPDGYINLTIDAVAFLSKLLKKLGA